MRNSLWKKPAYSAATADVACAAGGLWQCLARGVCLWSRLPAEVDPPVDALGVVTFAVDYEPYNAALVTTLFAEMRVEEFYTDAEYMDLWILIEP